jgi:hypothetical protein
MHFQLKVLAFLHSCVEQSSLITGKGSFMEEQSRSGSGGINVGHHLPYGSSAMAMAQVSLAWHRVSGLI